MRTISEEELKILRSFAERINPNDPSAHNNLAIVYYQRGLFDEAIMELKKALDIDPEFYIAKLNLETILKKTRREEDLIEKYVRKVIQNPDDINARIELANTFYQLGKPVKALNEYREVLRVAPKNIDALKGIIRCYKKMGKFPEAIATIRRAQKMYPEDLELKLHLGEVFYNQGNYDSAIKVLKEVIQKDPNNARAHLFLSFALGEKGYLEEALEETLKAKELDPRLGKVESALGVEEGEVIAPADFLKETMGITEASADPYESKLNLVIAYKNKLFLKEAKEILKDLKNIKYTDEVRKLEAELFILEKDWNSALKILENIDQKDFHTWNMLGVVLVKIGEIERATRIFEGIKNYPYALNNLGCITVIYEPEKAEEMFKKAYEIEPGFFIPVFNMALIEFDRKNYDRAYELVKEVTEIERESPVFMVLEGRILMEKGKKGKAREIFRKVLEISPDFYEAAYWLSEIEENSRKEELESVLQRMGERPVSFEYLMSIEGSPVPIPSKIRVEKKKSLSYVDAEKELKRAKELIRNKKFEEAEEILLSLKDSSLKRDVFYLLGVVYENLGFTEDAESYFVRLLKEKEDERVLFHLARIYLKTGRLKEAEENVKKILFKGKEYIDVLILFARIKELQGNFQEVLFALRKILKKGKISVKIIKWIGEILENLKRYDAAIKEYRLALQKFPDDEELLYSLGRCLWKSGKSKELEKVKKELERLGKEEYVKLLTALELTSKEEYSLAIPLFKSLAGKFYFKEELHYYLGVCYALEGEYEKAIKSWSRVLKISPFSILGKKAKDYIDLALKWIKALEKGVKE